MGKLLEFGAVIWLAAVVLDWVSWRSRRDLIMEALARALMSPPDVPMAASAKVLQGATGLSMQDIYRTLRHMEREGDVIRKEVAAGPERGGRPAYYYKLQGR